MSSFHRDSWVEVNLDCIKENVTNIKKHLPSSVNVIAVVKANAYGHGDAQVAEAALEAGASYLAVSFLDEAISLRAQGITAPILVLGASRVSDISLAAEKNITLTVFQESWIKEAINFYKGQSIVKLHMKLDTGMGRIGARTIDEVDGILTLANPSVKFSIEGVYTHFATADELNNNYLNIQYDRFDKMLNYIETEWNLSIPIKHCGNSATALRFPNKVFNAVRVGISMYGMTPSLEMSPVLPFNLREAFSLHTKLVHVKRLEPGEFVSYGATYTTEKDEWIGTVPLGYADGLLRKLQGIDVLVDGKKAPIVGRICMDQFMIRLPYELPVGTKVTIIGSQENEVISCNDLAEKLETINYEIPCMISYRVPRMFKKNNQIVEVINYLQGN
ncbi:MULTISPECIES: alanine racemase [Bacillus]|uniref:alanine racemase n=1 Tax=Bacillus TaxID=1386 RepID=UPI000BB705C0|nr:MULTISPECIES: alanine racemase [Bacillus]